MVSGGQKTSMHGPFSVRPGGTEQEPEELNPDKETEAEDWGGSDKDRTQVLLLTFTTEVTKWRELNHTPHGTG